MKTGLVLEGGGLRGLFSAGVLDVMCEHGVSFDGIVGVSAGAAFGCNYKSGQPGRALRYNVVFAHDWRYCSWRSLLLTGNLFGAEFAYHTVAEELDPFDNEAFLSNPTEYHVVATDVATGQPVYRRIVEGGRPLYEWIRATSSMPLVSQVVNIEGRGLLDGGMTDSIPLRYFQQQGFGRNIVVLTQPGDYRKTSMPMMGFVRWRLRRYPRLAEAMAVRHTMYNAQLDYVAREEARGNTLVIRPEGKLPIGRLSHDAEKMLRAYRQGRSVAERRIAEIMAFCEPSAAAAR